MARLWESGTGSSVDEANEDMSPQEQVIGSQNMH
jgi:hypothetical protein